MVKSIVTSISGKKCGNFGRYEFYYPATITSITMYLEFHSAEYGRKVTWGISAPEMECNLYKKKILCKHNSPVHYDGQLLSSTVNCFHGDPWCLHVIYEYAALFIGFKLARNDDIFCANYGKYDISACAFMLYFAN